MMPGRGKSETGNGTTDADETRPSNTVRPVATLLGMSLIALGLLVSFQLVGVGPATGPPVGAILIVGGVLVAARSHREPHTSADRTTGGSWHPDDSRAVAATTRVLVTLQGLLDCSDSLRVADVSSNLLAAIRATIGDDSLGPALDRIHPALRPRLASLEQAVGEVHAISRNGGSPTGIGIPDSARIGIEEFREWVTTCELRLAPPGV